MRRYRGIAVLLIGALFAGGTASAAPLKATVRAPATVTAGSEWQAVVTITRDGQRVRGLSVTVRATRGSATRAVRAAAVSPGVYRARLRFGMVGRLVLCGDRPRKSPRSRPGGGSRRRSVPRRARRPRRLLHRRRAASRARRASDRSSPSGTSRTDRRSIPTTSGRPATGLSGTPGSSEGSSAGWSRRPVRSARSRSERARPLTAWSRAPTATPGSPTWAVTRSSAWIARPRRSPSTRSRRLSTSLPTPPPGTAPGSSGSPGSRATSAGWISRSPPRRPSRSGPRPVAAARTGSTPRPRGTSGSSRSAATATSGRSTGRAAP